MDTDITYGQPINLHLSPGTAWCLYWDEGPGGPCGQSMRITCPHAILMTWSNEEDMRSAMETHKWRNKKHKIMWGVIDQWVSGGVFKIINN